MESFSQLFMSVSSDQEKIKSVYRIQYTCLNHCWKTEREKVDQDQLKWIISTLLLMLVEFKWRKTIIEKSKWNQLFRTGIFAFLNDHIEAGAKALYWWWMGRTPWISNYRCCCCRSFIVWRLSKFFLFVSLISITMCPLSWMAQRKGMYVSCPCFDMFSFINGQ